MLSLPSKLVLAAVAGVGSHNMVFINGEWHMQAPLILRAYIFLAVITYIAEIINGHSSYLQSGGRSLLIVGTYGATLFMSMAFYRLFLHRLRGFPGPFWAKVSKLWHVGKCIQTSSQNHLVLDQLYKNYGEFVRTGD